MDTMVEWSKMSTSERRVAVGRWSTADLRAAIESGTLPPSVRGLIVAELAERRAPFRRTLTPSQQAANYTDRIRRGELL